MKWFISVLIVLVLIAACQPVAIPTEKTQEGTDEREIMVTSIVAEITQSAEVLAMPQISDAPAPPPTHTPAQTSVATPTPSLRGSELDAIFGNGNWFCFPDRSDNGGVKLLPANYVVASPVFKVDTPDGEFSSGEVVPGNTGATIWLEDNLLRSECPLIQQQAIGEWVAERSQNTSILSRDRIDDLLGAGNWYCVQEFNYAVHVRTLLSDCLVKYPMTSINTGHGGLNYGVGLIAPGGGEATVWFYGSIPSDQCR